MRLPCRRAPAPGPCGRRCSRARPLLVLSQLAGELPQLLLLLRRVVEMRWEVVWEELDAVGGTVGALRQQ